MIRALSFRNISAVYIFVAMFIVFSIWIPEKFLQVGVWRSLLDAEALTGLAAIAALIPLVAGSLNLAVGAQVGFTAILSAWLLGRAGLPIALQLPLVVVVGALIGLVTALVITRLRVEPIIATLGVSSILLAGMAWLSGSQQILDLGPDYREIATTQVGGVTLPVYILLAVALVTWYVLERTPVGRRMYAAGYNPDGARLAGVRVERLQVGTLMAGGAIAALAGALLTSRINAGDPTVGPSFLLPALTAVFLGSTQFRGGRFNVWGTIVAMYVLAVGIKGLQLGGSPRWVNDLFYGVALLLAVALAQWSPVVHRTSAIRRVTRLLRRRAT
ncbi:monosaccharide ABC transporter membrane protein (CUT2 family) [Promicromonospora sp. AC04]|uniref:ABC transporter permease n=1 Tax=Promicromonospora sp. AC04 TaxID=2135723 RepID=UPI000D38871B|nr:ABC transporter permease [Promicromonospora sp. AC04]PUB27882.1 monosaccharide ABC transporter membrane protein (CUT2 family) [Promicromonospora sp. AC04]